MRIEFKALKVSSCHIPVAVGVPLSRRISPCFVIEANQWSAVTITSVRYKVIKYIGDDINRITLDRNPKKT